MQTTRKIDKKKGRVTITITGEAEFLKTIKTCADDMLNDPDFHPGMDSLWDLRAVEMKNLFTNDLRALVSFIEVHQQERGAGYKVAVVVKNDLLFGGARMFEAFVDTMPFNCRIFRDIIEAESWLDVHQ